MRRWTTNTVTLACGWLAALAGPAQAADGTVTLPLAEWAATTAKPPPSPSPEVALPIRRTLTGRYGRGLLTAELAARFEVRAIGPVPVPVLPVATTVSAATLDGRPVSLRDDGNYWLVDALPGAHEVRIQLLQGQQNDRFARRLALALPPGGPTAVDLVVPEAPIEPTLTGGVLVAAIASGDTTRLTGWLDANGALDLGWERRSDAPLDPGTARLETEVDAVLTLGEDVVSGIASYATTVREGEIDRIDLVLPPDVEVLDVTGDGVLQWHTADRAGDTAGDAAGAQLVVLLRGIVDDAATATVRFQYPIAPDQDVAIRVPVPPDGVTYRGALGVEAAASLGVEVRDPGTTRPLEPRDVPQAVLALTENPLRAVMAFDTPPQATLGVTRQADVEVSTTRIDDLQGITVLVEDGTEIGKLLLTVRNTTRQVLTVDLPTGARLTHCFRDGVPLRPGADPALPERVLVPLTRSERPTSAATVHVVEPGEMLSSIALRYYGNGAGWTRIADANDGAANGLQVGQTLVIPSQAEASLEQSFSLELGWERHADPLGPIGARAVALPRLDLDVMAANWHLYLPETVEPLWLTGAGPVQRVGELHADPVERVLDLFAAAGALTRGGAAYAGDVSYENVLYSRRKVYDQEKRASAEVGTDPFPLVGVKYRLRGVLLGTEPATARVGWITSPVAGAVRGVAWALAAALTVGVALTRRGPNAQATLWGALAALAAALVVAHHVLGVHRHLAWGVDAGLLVALIVRWVRGATLSFALPGRAWGCATLVIALFATLVVLVRWELLPLWLGAALAVAHRRSS